MIVTIHNDDGSIETMLDQAEAGCRHGTDNTDLRVFRLLIVAWCYYHHNGQPDPPTVPQHSKNSKVAKYDKIH